MATLTDSGLQIKTLQNYIDDYKASLTEKFGAGHVLTDDNPIVKILSIVAASDASLEEAIEAVYNSQYPATATGISLDLAAETTGHYRQPASKTTAIVYGWAEATVLVTAGSQVSKAVTGETFLVDADTTIPNNPTPGATRIGATQLNDLGSGIGEITTASAHGLSPGDYIAFIDSAFQAFNHVFLVDTVPLPTTARFNFTGIGGLDATVTYMYYAQAIPVTAVEAGATDAPSRSINVIDTPITSWIGVENYSDATTGNNEETDAEFRARREDTLTQLAGGTFESIKSSILNTTGVTSANLFVNETGATAIIGGLSIPPYSIASLVQGGADADIAQTLFDSVSAGVPTFGTTTIPITDSEGNTHNMSFSRLTSAPIRIDLVITEDEGVDLDVPATEASIKQSIVDYFQTLEAGSDVLVSSIIGYVVQTPGFYINSITIDDDLAGATPVTTKIAISPIELATIDTGADVYITINAASP